MQFGMQTLIENKDIEETASICHRLKLDFIELNMNLPQYQVASIENSYVLEKIAEKYGIYYTVHLDENLNVCDFNKAVANAYIDTVKRTIEVAKKLKIPVLNMHMNQGVYFTLPNQKVHLFKQYHDSYWNGIKHYRQMCEDTIADSDIKISIENTNGYRDFEKEAIAYLLESDVFSLTWDIGHSHAHEESDKAFIMEHQDKLHHFHIHDGIGKKNHLTLGSGEIDLKARLAVAKKNHCRCVIETKTAESLKKSMDWLNTNQKGGNAYGY